MNFRKKILLVDDDEDLRTSLAEQLGVYEKFSASEAVSGAEALEAIKAQSFDLVLLDICLPDMGGHELSELLRRNEVKSPIIMLTDADSEFDTILGHNVGINDYITKPFRFSMLLARISAQLRRQEQSDDATFPIGRYTFCPAAKLLIDPDSERKVHLTEKETAILKYFHLAQNQVVGRDVLLNEVWGYNAGVGTHTLETHIYRLRQKIEANPSNAELLVTEGGGYRLVR